MPREKIVKSGPLALWTQSFGDEKDPCVLLSVGAGVASIAWPDRLCYDLSQKGFCVIRHDWRDCGLSDGVDFDKAPYTLWDLSNDLKAILDAYGKEKAHIVGMSMGGMVSQIFCAKYPERAMSLTNVMSSPDHTALAACMRSPKAKVPMHPLPPPDPEYLKVWFENLAARGEDSERRLALGIANWRCLAHPATVDDAELEAFEKRLRTREKGGHKSLNHLLASVEPIDRRPLLKTLDLPSLVIHGERDRAMPLPHGLCIAACIKGSFLKVHPELGHFLCESVIDLIVENLYDFFASI